MPHDHRNRPNGRHQSHRPDRDEYSRDEDYGWAGRHLNQFSKHDRDRFDENFRGDRDQRGRFLSSATGYGEDYRYEGDTFDGRYRDEFSDRDIRSAEFNQRPTRDQYRSRDRYDYGRGYGSDTGYSSEMVSANYGSASGTRNHTGRGPKGWKRSDERIKDDVSESLERHPDIDASEIEVNVKDGIVILSGSVDHRRSKRLAEDMIETISGVKDIRNELSVNQSLFDQAREFLTGENVKSNRNERGRH